ncbi:MAG: hypothetical protein ACI9YE_002262, partial [Psychroserpens sp.]
ALTQYLLTFSPTDESFLVLEIILEFISRKTSFSKFFLFFTPFI